MPPRYELGRKVEERSTYYGVYECLGSKPGSGGRPTTVLLVQIRSAQNGQIVADHLWFNRTKRFQLLGKLKKGEVLQFDARVKTYKKGNRIDYKLSYPTNIIRHRD